ncbi:hypothetical protein ACGFNU_00245 [Spirillospora sp. NPDC048911]|uniref:hypothetical protein n=1 Tax=Spirillospora sp. NPDC048911 TaxID=3364527 RepID=UPI003721BCF9
MTGGPVRRYYQLPGDIGMSEDLSAMERRKLNATLAAAIKRATGNAAPGATIHPAHGTPPLQRFGPQDQQLGPVTRAAPSGDAEAEILTALNTPVGPQDSVAQRRRIDRLIVLFDGLAPGKAKELLARLENPKPSDRLAEAFRQRLSTATRSMLTDRLRTRANTVEVTYSKSRDPQDDPRYIDKAIDEVQCRLIYADRYILVWKGGRKVVHNDDIDWTKTSKSLPVIDVQPTEAAARALAAEHHDLAVLANYDRAVAFYRDKTGVILPTWFSPATAPGTYALIMGVNAQVRETAREYEEGFRDLRNGMIVGAILGGALRVFVRLLPGGGGFRGSSSGGKTPSTPEPAPPKAPPESAPPQAPPEPAPPKAPPESAPVAVDPAVRARALAKAARDAGDEVVANIGGAGASHEPQHAININDQTVPRKGIPNHVEADGSKIGELFEPGSLDRVTGHRMPPGVVNWNEAAPGAFRALRSGGRFEYSWQGGNADAAACAKALEAAGFKDVKVVKDVLVTAVKP